MKVIAFVSGKGGVGKTTITGAIGHMLSVLDKKVVMVDCNMTTPHLGLYVGLHDSPTTLNNVVNKQAHVEDALYNHTTGFGIIPASIQLKDLGGIDLSRIKDIIKEDYKEFFEAYDYVLLDCAPGLGREAIAGIKAADEAILITMPHLPSVMDAIKCKETLNELNIKILGLVVNMVNGYKIELSKEYIQNLTNMPVISTIPTDKQVLYSLGHRVPISLFKPKSKASKNIYDIVKHILTNDEIPQAQYQKNQEESKQKEISYKSDPLPQDIFS